MTAAFSGLSVALATPFTPDGEVDLVAFRALIRHTLTGGADVLVVLGSTGEAATLLEPERDRLVEVALAEASGHPVVVGTGHNATREAARLTRRAQELGAAGALVVTPYYNKPTPAGLIAHYAAVADAAPGLPLIAYNVPSRTGQNLTPETLARLWENPQVVAVKESSGNLRQIEEIALALPPGRLLLAGDDDLALPALTAGAAGLVSVVANLVPRETKTLVEAARSGDFPTARVIQARLLPLIQALFRESNPIPLKAGLALLGLAHDGVRLPLTAAEAATRQAIRRALVPFRLEASA